MSSICGVHERLGWSFVMAPKLTSTTCPFAKARKPHWIPPCSRNWVHISGGVLPEGLDVHVRDERGAAQVELPLQLGPGPVGEGVARVPSDAPAEGDPVPERGQHVEWKVVTRSEIQLQGDVVAAPRVPGVEGGRMEHAHAEVREVGLGLVGADQVLEDLGDHPACVGGEGGLGKLVRRDEVGLNLGLHLNALRHVVVGVELGLVGRGLGLGVGRQGRSSREEEDQSPSQATHDPVNLSGRPCGSRRFPGASELPRAVRLATLARPQ